MVVSVGACRPAPWLAADHEVLRRGGRSTASQMHVGTEGQALAAALVVQRWILRLSGMNSIGTILRAGVKLQLAWQRRASEHHLLTGWQASVGGSLVAAGTI